MYAYFKLFHSIKDEHEVQLARLELESLVGPVEVVRNFVDELLREPMNALVNSTQTNIRNDESDNVRFQDFLTHEVAYGKVQGFMCRNLKHANIEPLVRKLGYTREIYIIDQRKSWKRFLSSVFSEGCIGKNCNVFASGDAVAVRSITNQYFLERCEHVLKITPSLKRKRIIEFADRMFDNLMRFVYRIPASAKARVGKRFLDYLADREEPSLYLSHGLHPYKGKFHPKMSRALINIVHPEDEGTIMDNFAGSGTLLVESSFMGFDSYGVEINPMSVLMSNAKCALMRMDPEELDNALSRFLGILRSEFDVLSQREQGQSTLVEMKYEPNDGTLDEIRSVAEKVYDDFASGGALNEILVARRIIEDEFSGETADILKLGLAMVISNLKGKKRKEVVPQVQFVMEDIFRRCYLLDYLKRVVTLKIGTGKSLLGDASDFKNLKEIQKIDGNVNSPPYSTALDYVKNDLNQIALLGLIKNSDDLAALEQSMGGNPRAMYDSVDMEKRISENAAGLSEYAIRLVRLMYHFGKQSHAFRLYNFFSLIKNSLLEQMRVLKPGARIATVIGNNHFKLTDNIDMVTDEPIKLANSEFHLSSHSVVNNLRAIDPTPITGDEILLRYGPSLPIRVSVDPTETNPSRSGVFVEIENERVLLLLGMDVGFEPYIIINRYLEKTLRGNIRYESIVVLRKPC